MRTWSPRRAYNCRDWEDSAIGSSIGRANLSASQVLCRPRILPALALRVGLSAQCSIPERIWDKPNSVQAKSQETYDETTPSLASLRLRHSRADSAGHSSLGHLGPGRATRPPALAGR